jgi:hypothetical protein
VAALQGRGFGDLVPIKATPESPGDRPWLISISDDASLRLPVDPQNAFTVNTPLAPWLDEPVWCLEQAKRNRTSPLLSQDSRDRLRALKAAPTKA